jgi:hypothetical protein
MGKFFQDIWNAEMGRWHVFLKYWYVWLIFFIIFGIVAWKLCKDY